MLKIVEKKLSRTTQMYIHQKIGLSSELSLEDKTVGDPKNAWFVRNILKHRDVF